MIFAFKWYGNTWNKKFYSQRIWIGYNIELAESVYVHVQEAISCKELLYQITFCTLTCRSMRSVGQLQTCNARFLSTYLANDCKLAAVGCETGTGLEAFEEWESGLEEAWEGAVEHKTGCCDPGSWGLASLRAACCGNRTGDPGEERCGLSSFKCKGTVDGCTVWCGITAFAATPAAADGTGDKMKKEPCQKPHTPVNWKKKFVGKKYTTFQQSYYFNSSFQKGAQKATQHQILHKSLSNCQTALDSIGQTKLSEDILLMGILSLVRPA